MAGVGAAPDRERAGLARACGLPQPQRRPLPRGAAGAALPRRRVRADRREGHDRVHDPRGRRAVEAVAARLLRVLRRQGRARARPVRGDRSAKPATTSTTPSPPKPTRSRGCAPTRSGSTSGATRSRPPASGAPTTGARSPSSRCSWPPTTRSGFEPRSRRSRTCCIELLDAAAAAGAIRVADTRRAAALVHQTVMNNWYGNRLVNDPKQRLTAEETWEFCLHGIDS